MTLTLPAPRMIDPGSVPGLRWGLIGTGIAAKFVRALQRHTHQRAVAVTARDASKTAAFAAEYGIPTVYGTVSDLLTDDDVDVVYIATPHSSHRELALAAIAAGKHVLVEKPIAVSAEETREITRAGRRAGVLVMEAMWTRYLPQADVIRQVIDEGILGDISLVRADFGFVMPMIPEHRLWNPALAGGAMLDVGVYPVSFASSVIGQPDQVLAVGTVSQTGVDAQANVVLRTSTGSQAVLSASLLAHLPVDAGVYGSKGRLGVLSPFFGPSGLQLTTVSKRGAETTIIAVAREQSLAITAAIWLGEQLVFHSARPGTSSDNDRWLQRKAAVVRRYDSSSMLMRERFTLAGISAPHAALGVDPAQFAFAGGAIPIRIGATQVGVAAASGLSDEDDHALVAQALNYHREGRML